jgi:hypothetical protein
LTIFNFASAGRYRPFPNPGFDALNDIKLDPLINQYSIPSVGRYRCRQVNPRHTTMTGEAFMSVIPFDGDILRVRRFDRAAIGFIAVETDARAGFRVLDCSGVIG